MDAAQSLDAVRRKIDAIDDAIHDLIMQRTELIDTVSDLKRDMPIKIRPSREAEIVYRLLARHKGAFPRRELTAIWRHLIMATLSFEGPFSVAVFMPASEAGYWDLARDHFGMFTPMSRHGSLRSVIEAVQRQDAVVGVLPLPRSDDPDPWWRLLASDQPEVPRIIARLPFAGPANGIGGALEALTICPISITPTGRDRTYLAFDLTDRLSLDQCGRELAASGLEPRSAAIWEQDHRPQSWLYLVEVEGCLAPEDPRLAAAKEAFGNRMSHMTVIGGYATPLTLAELGPQPRPAALSAPPAPRPEVARSGAAAEQPVRPPTPKAP